MALAFGQAFSLAATAVPASARAGGSGFAIESLSSAPDQVSGGSVLVRVTAPGRVPVGGLVILRNGEDVTPLFGEVPVDAPPRFSRGFGGVRLPSVPQRSLVGLVDGLELGANEIVVKPNPRSQAVLAELTVVNHPIGGPIFSGPQQQPFVCTTARNGLGQPLVDNQDGIGIPVALEDAGGSYPSDGRGYPTAAAQIVGFSKDCAAETRIEYRYRTTGGQLRVLADPAAPLPEDIAMTTLLDGRTVPYIIRLERGTINRFLYSIAMLAPTTETDSWDPDRSLWNGRLVLSLQGGVAIGRTQGVASNDAMMRDDVLSRGYAVVNSTGLRTNTHYNLQLGGETALMVKEHFIKRHGVPLYTVGVGGSGGAIQQYVYAQNHPGLLDAAIPQYGYPDMITQTIHVGDCELLEHYFDRTDGANPKWLDHANRRAIQGLNATDHPRNMSAGETEQWSLLYFLYSVMSLPVMHRDPDSDAPALTECRRAWFGLSPLVLNPTFTNVQDIDKLAQGVEGVEWTHGGDLVNIYGLDESGFARVPWDNEGVQYGLAALRDGTITPEEFLHLNANVGSWKESKDIVPEGFPFAGAISVPNFDPWSRRNMKLSPDGGATPAARRTGDPEAIRAAYESGMVFRGEIDIPVIDWRHWLEHELDMHHSHQSFAARQRIRNAMGGDDHHLIWFTDARPAAAFDQTPEAFEVIDEWMANIRANPHRSVAENRPARAVDRCFDTQGHEIAAGEDVWDGVLDDRDPGACTQVFPLYRSSRIVAGGPIEGGIFKCQRKSVAEAIADGAYGDWVPSEAQQQRLEEIFPSGVCDWDRGDALRPPGL